MVPTLGVSHNAVPAVAGKDAAGAGRGVCTVLRSAWRPVRFALLAAVPLLVAAVTVRAAGDCGAVRARPGEALVVFTRTKMMGWSMGIEVRFGDGTSAALGRKECAARSMPAGRTRIYARFADFFQELTVPERYAPRLPTIPFGHHDAFGMVTAKMTLMAGVIRMEHERQGETKGNTKLGVWGLPEDIAADPAVRQTIIANPYEGAEKADKWIDIDLQPDHTYYFNVYNGRAVAIDAITEKEGRSALGKCQSAPLFRMNDNGTYTVESPGGLAPGDSGADTTPPKNKDSGQ